MTSRNIKNMIDITPIPTAQLMFFLL